ncbi:hypothetical protein HNR12_000871 [Streptomonospora nanhaiensis]|uniref:Uncharacterized protein n=1 Tax=Streptomonospora nanhaiensis TaxID=1323731 RepID=A0A853BIP9_9ACTN|nr:hypothetical protein [Streptomonospora nanhaiensis]
MRCGGTGNRVLRSTCHGSSLAHPAPQRQPPNAHRSQGTVGRWGRRASVPPAAGGGHDGASGGGWWGRAAVGGAAGGWGCDGGRRGRWGWWLGWAVIGAARGWLCLATGAATAAGGRACEPAVPLRLAGVAARAPRSSGIRVGGYRPCRWVALLGDGSGDGGGWPGMRSAARAAAARVTSGLWGGAGPLCRLSVICARWESRARTPTGCCATPSKGALAPAISHGEAERPFCDHVPLGVAVSTGGHLRRSDAAPRWTGHAAAATWSARAARVAGAGAGSSGRRDRHLVGLRSIAMG